MAEDIDLEMCSYGQLLEDQMLRDLELGLGSGEGHLNIHSICRTTSVPTHQIKSKSEKLFVDIRTDGQTKTPEFQSTRSSVGNDLKINRFWQMIPNN